MLQEVFRTRKHPLSWKQAGQCAAIFARSCWTDKSNNRLSDDLTNVTGEALVTETYVHVRWEWLAFISSQTVLSVILLAMVVYQARNSGIGVVKSSILPAFLAIDARDRDLLDNGGAPAKQQGEVDDLLRDGLGDGWRLRLTDHGWTVEQR